LLTELGFRGLAEFTYKTYDELKDFYKTKELSHLHENKMLKDFGPVVFCQDFPVYTSPFWNMKQKSKTHAHKIDVIVEGNETIGSAERSTNATEMKDNFYTISEGKYAQKLFDLFGKRRVEKELHDFLSLDFFPRSGGGIGMSRLIDAMKKESILHGAAVSEAA
jgi:aspartyl/asparaginyl-tRNA synthetase